MTREERIKKFWLENHENRVNLYTTYLGYKPIETVTGEDEIFIYDCWQRSLKERIEQPLINKIVERENFIVELFNAAMHQKVFKNEENFKVLYEKYNQILNSQTVSTK